MGWGRGVQGARRVRVSASGRDWGILVRPRSRLVSAGIAALAAGFVLGLKAEPPGIAAFATVFPAGLDFRPSFESQTPATQGFQLASLEMVPVSGSALDDKEVGSDSAASRISDSFDLFLDRRQASFAERRLSFKERFAAATVRIGLEPEDTNEASPSAVLPAPDPGRPATRLAVRESTPDRTPAASSSPGASKKRRAAETPNDLEADSRTAIYDITAHTVYLPNGKRLEAHSGLGSFMDDVRYVNAKARGPTPPNVYALTMREQLFHGVRAIRLNPVGGGDMYGRDGMLAHTYMLGPNGQSNGCVSFSDYSAFLNAYLNGEIDRLVVVEHLGTPPDPQTPSGWLADRVKAFFVRS